MKNLLAIKHHGDAPSIYANDGFGNGFGDGLGNGSGSGFGCEEDT